MKFLVQCLPKFPHDLACVNTKPPIIICGLYVQMADYTRNSLSVRNISGMIKRLTRKGTVVLEGMLYIIYNEYLATIVVTGTGTRLLSG